MTERLVAAQLAAQAVAKQSVNSYMKYRYASAEAMIEEARGALSASGLALITAGWVFVRNDAAATSAIDNPGHVGLMRVHYALLCPAERLDFHCDTAVIVDKGRPLDKAQATALTYNLGYFLRGLLLLPREDAENSVDARDDRQHAARPPEPRQAELPQHPLANANTDSVAATALIRDIQRHMARAGLTTIEGRARVSAMAGGRGADELSLSELAKLRDQLSALQDVSA